MRLNQISIFPEANNRIRLNKIGILPETNNIMRFNKIGYVPQAKGGMVTANLRMFTFAELGSATRGFSPDMMLEVDLCGRFYHPNIVKLLGFCSEGEEFMLVYEYTPKGNLERYTYKDSGKSLSWVVWLKILIGAARYLAFLHSSEDRIVYGDFRPSNILLDGDFNPKMCDSGHARCAPDDADSCSDVRMRVVDFNARNKKMNLVDKARPVLACERKFKTVVNPKLLEQKYCPKGVESILSDVPALALQCLDLDPEKRPSMKQVLKILEDVNAVTR
ncbi:hypothetical protein DCAR_0832377 [Daucus carota subsp. sativus]|uniref:Uncharacterized protein n=1 Tax=Daucus carota subsp. sativus TaxID=79200 RepID=A0A175YQ84_DAUCS|nr:hypothetical protein DCAR_0832377 [Daucus carota subsp. sativus]